MSEPESLQEFAERMKVFLKNRQEFPEEELLKYAGQWIAWSPDGTAIVASSAESEAIVYQTLQARGYDIARCCVGYVDSDAVDLGGALLFAGDDAEEAQGGGPR